MIACRKDTPYTSIEAMRSTKSPARFGEGGTGSISYVFSAQQNQIVAATHLCRIRLIHKLWE